MRTPDDDYCPFELEVTQHEHDALDWLMKTCEKIANNPKSCNRVRAKLAMTLVEKMHDQLNDSHVMLHDLECKVAEQAMELASHSLIGELAKKSSTEGLN